MSTGAEFKKVEIRISDDALRAVVRIPAAAGAEPVTPSLLTQLAKDQGLALDKELHTAIERVAADYNANPRDLEALIATGAPPGPATPAIIQWASGFDPTSPPGPQQAPDEPDSDRTDHYASRADYVRVKPGDRLGVLFPPEPGTPGRNVRGEPIEPDAPPDPDATFDPQTITLEDDNTLVASIGGILTFHNHTASVDELLVIDSDVDFSTGHVQTEGSLLIRGDVKDNFHVQASGSIEIRGLVEAAHVRAGKDLTLAHGVAGRDRAEIFADGDLSAGYINDTKVRVRGSVRVKREIVGCEIVVGGSIIAERASIIGGMTVVTQGLRVAALGCTSETPTFVALGFAPFTTAQRWLTRERLDELLERIATLNCEMESLRHRERLDNAGKERLTELQFDAQSLAQEEARLEAMIEQLRAEERGRAGVEIIVSSMIYPNVTLATSNGRLKITTPIKGASHIERRTDGQLMIRSNSGAPMPLSSFCRAAA